MPVSWSRWKADQFVQDVVSVLECWDGETLAGRPPSGRRCGRSAADLDADVRGPCPGRPVGARALKWWLQTIRLSAMPRMAARRRRLQRRAAGRWLGLPGRSGSATGAGRRGR